MVTEDSSGQVVIAGGAGFLGHALTRHLQSLGWSVVVLTRGASRTEGETSFVHWNGSSLGDWCGVLDHASAVVNLCGRSVDCIKTPDHQDEILRSRLSSTLVLGEAMRSVPRPPPVWIQMSTAHLYGDPPAERCTEGSPAGYGFAPYVGQAWEAAFNESVLAAQRRVILRTSFVIGRDQGAGGGALARLKLLARWGLGGRVGAGTQGLSWIHETDFCRIVERAISEPGMEGVYITSAPHPVAQSTFMRELRQAMRVPFGLPAPSWLVRLGAPLLLQTDPELALYGRYVIPARLQSEGFEFQFPTITAALGDLCLANSGQPSSRKDLVTVRNG